MVLTAMEMLRANLEGITMLLSRPALAAGPRGDGHGVLVLPGFATDDSSSTFLRSFLADIGYAAFPWGLGMNLDHRTAGMEGENVARQIQRVVELTGRKVSLVGWSLGGVIAREAARRNPQAVRQVITIASPFGGNPRANHARLAYEWLSGNKVDSPRAIRRFALGAKPLSVPSTSIYSRTDGITAWENCLAEPDHQTENVEVHGSHFGMMMNTVVFRIVADRLAQPEGSWAPFMREVQKASS